MIIIIFLIKVIILRLFQFEGILPHKFENEMKNWLYLMFKWRNIGCFLQLISEK